MSEALTGPLRALLGDEAVIALAEHWGGTRLYIPHKILEDSEIAQAIGLEAAQRLSRRYTAATLRIPLARELRALHYRGVQGLSNARIALKLGMCETSVNKLFARLDHVPDKGALQLSLDI